MRRPEYAGGVRAPFLALIALFVLPVLLPLGGCGYSSGFRAPAGVRTLAVPMLENHTFPLRRDVEVDVTRALKEELSRRSDLRIVGSDESADAVLEGRILEFRQGVLAEGADDAVQESGITVRMRVRLVRTRDGSVLMERVIQDYASYSNIAGEGIEVARAEAVRELARRIVPQIEPSKQMGSKPKSIRILKLSPTAKSSNTPSPSISSKPLGPSMLVLI